VHGLSFFQAVFFVPESRTWRTDVPPQRGGSSALADCPAHGTGADEAAISIDPPAGGIRLVAILERDAYDFSTASAGLHAVGGSDMRAVGSENVDRGDAPLPGLGHMYLVPLNRSQFGPVQPGEVEHLAIAVSFGPWMVLVRTAQHGLP
jgi:hypothetical protein